MSNLLDNEDSTLFARDEPGPVMDPAAADLVFAALDVFEENPHIRTVVGPFLQANERGWQYTLLGLCLRLAGLDMRVLNPINERWNIGVALCVEHGFTAFDFYALEELFRHAESPQHAQELFEDYVVFPCRIDPALREGRPPSWR
jgi:hypothetical protein